MSGVSFNPNNNTGSAINPNDPNAAAAPPDVLAKTSAALSEVSTLAKAMSLKDTPHDISSSLQNLRNSNNPIGNAPAPPPPGGIAPSSVGAWISGNYLTALFMSITEFASIMKEVAFLGNKLKITEQSLVVQLGKSSAAQIIEAGKKEAGMYIASAIASLAEGAVALASVVVQKKSQDRAEASGDKIKNQKKDAAADSKTKADAAEVELKNSKQNVTEMQQKQNLAQDKLTKARKNSDQVKADPNSTDKQKIDAQRKEVDAERKFDSAVQDTRDAKAKEFKAQSDYDNKKAQADRDSLDFNKFDVQEYTVNAAQQNALALTQSLNAFGKFMDSSMNFLKAALVTEKSQAEAQSKILDTYMQIAMKGIDNAAEQEKAAHDMIASLFQALQKYSDDMNKLVNTITAAQRGA